MAKTDIEKRRDLEDRVVGERSGWKAIAEMLLDHVDCDACALEILTMGRQRADFMRGMGGASEAETEGVERAFEEFAALAQRKPL